MSINMQANDIYRQGLARVRKLYDSETNLKADPATGGGTRS